MSEETEIDRQSGVDRGLVAMFLRMSPGFPYHSGVERCLPAAESQRAQA